MLGKFKVQVWLSDTCIYFQMLTTVRLVTTSFISQNYLFCCCCCDYENIKVLIVTFKYTVVLLTIAIMLFLRWLTSLHFSHPSAFQIFSCVTGNNTMTYCHCCNIYSVVISGICILCITSYCFPQPLNLGKILSFPFWRQAKQKELVALYSYSLLVAEHRFCDFYCAVL